MKTTQDIIKEAVGERQNWKDVYKAVYTTVQMNTHRVLRHGNTLVWLKLLPNQNVEMFVFTADKKQEAVGNLAECLKAALAAGFQEIYFDAPYEDAFEFLEPMGFRVDSAPVEGGYRGVIRGLVESV